MKVFYLATILRIGGNGRTSRAERPWLNAKETAGGSLGFIEMKTYPERNFSGGGVSKVDIFREEVYIYHEISILVPEPPLVAPLRIPPGWRSLLGPGATQPLKFSSVFRWPADAQSINGGYISPCLLAFYRMPGQCQAFAFFAYNLGCNRESARLLA